MPLPRRTPFSAALSRPLPRHAAGRQGPAAQLAGHDGLNDTMAKQTPPRTAHPPSDWHARSVEQTLQDQAVAAGTAAFSQGWCSIHGMRTIPARRGRGLAARILVALANTASEHKLERVFLQVEEGNVQVGGDNNYTQSFRHGQFHAIFTPVQGLRQ